MGEELLDIWLVTVPDFSPLSRILSLSIRVMLSQVRDIGFLTSA
ncbi:uncharacterized protein METZ01_LOCUS147735 [marine metagenome]|uniref:Uncharacterized protein n=1 Tax=marine metagenome TaxID=408172 RepID=A0A382A0W2_9ZZZZ